MSGTCHDGQARRDGVADLGAIVMLVGTAFEDWDEDMSEAFVDGWSIANKVGLDR